MPQLVASAVVTALFSQGIVVSGLYTFTYWATVAGYFAYAAYQQRAAKARARDAFNASLTDRLVMTATTDAPRSRVYGRVRHCDGILFKASHGPRSEYYTFVIALAGHEIDAVEDVYFNDTKVQRDAQGYVLTEPYAIVTRRSVQGASSPSPAGTGSITAEAVPVAGSVSAVQQIGTLPNAYEQTVPVTVNGTAISYTGATFSGDAGPVRVNYQVDDRTSKARVQVFTGSNTQNISSALIAAGVPGITSAHMFRGIACLVVTLTYDQDAYAQGVPTITAKIRGAKVYDPRTGTTVWTQNPALIARDWALNGRGGGCMPEDIDDSMLIASANACDTVHKFPVVTTGAALLQFEITTPIYQCGIVVPGDGDPSDAFNEIIASMAGKYAWCGGKLRIKAGMYTPPVTASTPIDESWIADTESIEITSGVARADLINIYRPKIFDAAQEYVMAPTHPLRAQTYIDADGEEHPRDIVFAGITDTWHAQHVASCLLRDARQALVVKLPCNLRAYPVEVFDVVTVSLERFGWVAKEFEVLSWAFSATGGVVLTAKETAAAIWDPDAQFPVDDVAPNTALPLPWYVVAPTNVHVTSGTAALIDGSIVTRTLVEWDPITQESVRQSGKIEVQFTPAFEAIPDGDWQSIPPADGGATQATIVGLKANTAYLFRARAVNSVGVRSKWAVAQVHVVAPPPPVAGTYLQEDAPDNPMDGDLWYKPSDGIIYRWDANVAAWIQFGAIGAGTTDWTSITGKPKLFRVVARGGLDVTSNHIAGFFNGETDSAVPNVVGTNRSYNFARLRRSDGVVTFSRQYDIYAPGSGQAGMYGPADLTADLNATGSDSIVVLWTFDEPQTGRTMAGMPAAMYRCGASRAVFGSPQMAFRSAYALIGIGGCGEGNGFEAYGYVSDTNAFCDVAFTLLGGNMIVTGSGATPRTLADYSYTGSLDATTDVALVARGSCVVAGNYASKPGGAVAWDSDVYSRDAFKNAGYATAMAVDNTHSIMFGLNSDPTFSTDFGSIDYAIYLVNDGSIQIYQSNVQTLLPGWTYAANDVFAVVYDGSRMAYRKNGVDMVTPVSVTAGKTLAFDSSFQHPGGALKNIRFAPMSANDWASIGGVTVTTGQIGANQVTENISQSLSGTLTVPSTSTNEITVLSPGILDSQGGPILVVMTLAYYIHGTAGQTYTIRVRYNNIVVHTAEIAVFSFGTFLNNYGSGLYSRSFTIPSSAPGGHALTVTVQPQTAWGASEYFELFGTPELGGTTISAVGFKR